MLPTPSSTSEPVAVPQTAGPQAVPSLAAEGHEPAPGATPEPAKNTRKEEEKRRLSRLYIATTLAAGLLMAAGYVGTRIFAGKPKLPTPPREASLNPAPLNQVAANVASPAPEKSGVQEAPVDSVTPAPAPEALAKAAIASAVPQPISPNANEPESADDPGFIRPQHGERYLQVAALSTPTVLRYVSELRRSQLQAVVVPGPRPGLVRVLIGPFSDRESLESVRAQMETLGVIPFVRSY
jgi:cell division septation protein DedD